MNKILLFLIAGTLTISGFAQNSIHTQKKGSFIKNKFITNNKSIQVLDTAYKAAICTNFYPDYNNNSLWIKNTVSNNTYDATAKLTQVINKDSSNTNLQSKINYTYDNFGNISLQLNQNWASNAWVNSYQNISTYNIQNDQTEWKTQQWINNSWVTNYGYQNVYTYDGNNNMTLNIEKSWKSYLGLYRNSWKYEDTYTNNKLSVEIVSDWDTLNNIWVYDEKIINILWHNYAEFQPLSYTTQKYVSNNWFNSERVTFTYTGNNYVAVTDTFVSGIWTLKEKETYSEQDIYGSEIDLYEKYISGNWVNKSKYTTVYDNRKNQISSLDQIWQSGTWITDWESKNIYTYDLNNSITSQIQQNWDNQTQLLKNRNKYVYSNFQQIIGIQEISADLKIELFPNPVTSILNVYNKIYPYSVSIYNFTGQKLFDKTITDTNYSIDISEYPNGMYIISVNSKQSTENKIIIKE